MTEDDKIENSIIPISSNRLVRVGNSIEITNKIIREHEERLLQVAFTTLKIGNQEWMINNLDVEYYSNGDLIPQVQNLKEWESLKTGAWRYYEDDTENKLKNKKIYNWFAINDERGLAPFGFRVPSMKDWKMLFDEIYQCLINENGEIRHSNGVAKKYFTIMCDDVFFRLRDILFGIREKEGFHRFWTSTEINATSAIHTNFSFFGGGDIEEIFLEETLKHNGFYVMCIKI